nr:hypothetical protein [Anaerolineae bacterium]
MIKMINLTPHEITVVSSDGEIVRTFAPTGVVARVDQMDVSVGKLTVGQTLVPLVRSIYGDVINLPDPAPETLYIVSKMTMDASDREDLISPGRMVRGEDGKPLGCMTFSIKHTKPEDAHGG